MKQCSNLDRVMEPETISKNGTSSKSPMNRGNFRIMQTFSKLTLVVVIEAILVANSINAQTKPNTPIKYWDNSSVNIPNNSVKFIPKGIATIELTDGNKIEAVANTLLHFYDVVRLSGMYNTNNYRYITDHYYSDGLFKLPIDLDIDKDPIINYKDLKADDSIKIKFSDMKEIRPEAPLQNDEISSLKERKAVCLLASGKSIPLFLSCRKGSNGLNQIKKAGTFGFLECGKNHNYRWIPAVFIKSISFDWEKNPDVFLDGMLITFTDNSRPIITLAGAILIFQSNNTPAWWNWYNSVYIDNTTDYVFFSDIEKCTVEEITTDFKYKVKFVPWKRSEFETIFQYGGSEYREFYVFGDKGLMPIKIKTMNSIISLNSK